MFTRRKPLHGLTSPQPPIRELPENDRVACRRTATTISVDQIPLKSRRVRRHSMLTCIVAEARHECRAHQA